jgi:hypothetical protein
MSFFKTPLMTLLTSLFFYMLRPTSGDCLPRPVFSWTSPNDLTDILVFLRRYCAPFLQTVCRDMSFLGPPLMTSLTSLFFYLLRPISGDCLPRHVFSWISLNDLTDVPVFVCRCAPVLETACRDLSFLGPPLMTLLTSLFFKVF